MPDVELSADRKRAVKQRESPERIENDFPRMSIGDRRVNRQCRDDQEGNRDPDDFEPSVPVDRGAVTSRTAGTDAEPGSALVQRRAIFTVEPGAIRRHALPCHLSREPVPPQALSFDVTCVPLGLSSASTVSPVNDEPSSPHVPASIVSPS